MNKLMKLALLLVALVAGGGMMRADKVVIFKDDFGKSLEKIKDNWTLSGKYSSSDFEGGTGNNSLQIASGEGAGTATTKDAFSSLVGTTAILTFNLRSASSSGSNRTLTISGNKSCKLDGGESTTRDAIAGKTRSVTIVITEASKSSSITLSADKNAACKIDDFEISYIPINLAPACTDGNSYFGTFSCPSAFVVPSDLTVSEIKVVDGKLQLSSYSTDEIVPANTGVMVSSATAGDHIISFTTGGTSKLGDDNMLKPSGNGITASEMLLGTSSGTQFYRLTMHNGTQIGFWWGAEGGAAFALGANKAYLAVPTNGNARLQGMWMDGDSQRIEGVRYDTVAESHTACDLQGRRVDASRFSPLKKGLYIVDGKKMMVK